MDRLIPMTCMRCGKTYTLPENVQHWPNYCQACRAKEMPEERITRKCRGCGKDFTFAVKEARWPKLCPDCLAKRKREE